MIINRPNILAQDGIALYYEKVIADEEVEQLFESLLNNIHWENERVVMFGKEIITKRKVAFYSDPSISYRYASKTKIGLPWTSTLLTIKIRVESITKESYNACLLNLYHNGEESMGWHSDNEKEIIAGSSIASLSLGANRKFSFKHKVSKETINLFLQHGSLLLMKGHTQTHWLHRLPPTKIINKPRVNLTFRTIDR